MPADRRARILALLTRDGHSDLAPGQLCSVCAEVTGATGAGIMLMAGEIAQTSVCSTDAVSALIEQLQYGLGEGPCIDAYRNDRPVSEPDLVHPATIRWPAFTGPVVDAGARAVFGFPLHVGAARLGALNLYRDTPGLLTDEQHADALVMADIAAQAILMLQAEAPAGQLAAALEAGGDFQFAVHQAAGMVAAQLDVSIAHALVRLRAHSFATGRSLREIADDVVARRLRLAVDHPHHGDTTGDV